MPEKYRIHLLRLYGPYPPYSKNRAYNFGLIPSCCFKYFYVYECFVYMYLCTICLQCPSEVRRGRQTPCYWGYMVVRHDVGAGIELLCCGRAQGLLATEPSPALYTWFCIIQFFL